jgi:hypothetical protein
MIRAAGGLPSPLPCDDRAVITGARMSLMPACASRQGLALRPYFRRARWLVLAPGVFAGYVWGKGHVVPTLDLLSFCVAFVVVGFLGAVLHGFLRDAASSAEAPRPGVFHLLWLGQYALFALALAAALLGASVTALTRRHLPLRISLPLVMVAALLVIRRSKGPLLPRLPRIPFASWLLAAGVCFGFFRTLALHSFHAGALGHDTLQHLYWINTVDDFGYLTLTARGTDLLENYPKAFHLMVAAWRSAGVFGLSGPYMKVMPFLQAALACGFVCELWLAFKPRIARAAPWIGGLLLGIFVSWHLTLGDGQEVYRVVDLSGTPRTSAGWLLFGPPLLVLGQRAGTLPDMRGWLIGTLPLVLAIALAINPVTVAYYLTFSLPFALVLYVFTRTAVENPLPSWRRCFAASGLLAVPLLVTNSTLVTALAKTPVVTTLLHVASVRTVTRGIPTYVFSEPSKPPAALCASYDISCAADLSQATLLGGIKAYWAALSSGTLPGIYPGTSSVWYFVVFAVPVIVLALSARRAEFYPSVSVPASKAFIAALLACLLVPLGMMIVNALMLRVEAQSDLLMLLSTYYKPHHVYLSSWLQCLLATASWSLLPAMRLHPRWFWATSLLASGLLVYHLSTFAPPALTNHRHAQDAWNIDWPELRAIKHLNEFVPREEAILIPSWHWQAGRENLLSTDGPEGPIVPHLTGRFLFGMMLGIGRDYSWADLAHTFCGPSVEARRKLLRKNNVRWVLLRGERVRSREFFNEYNWVCGIKLRELGTEYPPAWSERDLALYRIQP